MPLPLLTADPPELKTIPATRMLVYFTTVAPRARSNLYPHFPLTSHSDMPHGGNQPHLCNFMWLGVELQLPVGPNGATSIFQPLTACGATWAAAFCTLGLDRRGAPKWPEPHRHRHYGGDYSWLSDGRLRPELRSPFFDGRQFQLLPFPRPRSGPYGADERFLRYVHAPFREHWDDVLPRPTVARHFSPDPVPTANGYYTTRQFEARFVRGRRYRQPWVVTEGQNYRWTSMRLGSSPPNTSEPRHAFVP